MQSNTETSSNPKAITRDAQGRHLLTTLSGEQYVLINKIDQQEAKKIEQATGINLKFPQDEDTLKPLLGKGNFGKVRLAQRVSNGEYVAVKKQLLREHNRSALRREAELQQRLRGLAHVLSAYDTVEGVSKKKSTDEKPQEVMYIFLPLGGLGSVDKLIEPITALDDQALRQLVILEVSKALLLGLWHLHQQGIYHLDIKPENILVAQTGEVLIGDFGCAEIIPSHPPLLIPGERESRTIGRGDIYYISEAREDAWEKGEKGKGFDARAEDCWAAGLSIMELLGGQWEKSIDSWGRPESLLRFELDVILKALELEEEFPELVTIIRQLTHPNPPALSQILNEPIFQQASLHDPALRETAVHYLQTFAKAERPMAVSVLEDESLEKRIYDLKKSEEIKETEKTEDTPEEPFSTYHWLKSKKLTSYYPPCSQQAEENASNDKEIAPKRDKIPDDLPPLEPVIVSTRQKLHPLRSSRLPLRASVNPETIVQQWREQCLLKQQTLSQADAPFYIPLQGASDREGKSPFDLETQVETWLGNEQKVLALLADGGSGKSTFMRQWAAKQSALLVETMAETHPAYLPLYLSLVNVPSPKDWLQTILKAQGLDEEAIGYLQKTQPLLLLLDGYDEMPQYANLYVEGQLWQWSQIKLIITCRPSSIGQNYKIHFLPYQPGVSAQAGYEEYFIQPFDAKQQDSYVNQFVQTQQSQLQEAVNTQRLDAEWLDGKTYKTALAKLNGLEQLVQTPLLLRLVLTTLPELSQRYANKSHRVQTVEVYETFLQQWYQQHVIKIQQEVQERAKAYTPTLEETLNFAQRFAKALDTKGLVQTHYHPCYQFNPGLGSYERQPNPWHAFLSEVDEKASACRQCLPLRMTGDQTYSFMHLSIQEYLVARTGYHALRKLEADTKHSPETWVNTAAQLDLNQAAMGQKVQEQPKLIFLAEWALLDPAFSDLLWRIIESSRDFEELGNLSSNSASILGLASLLEPQEQRVSFKGRDLSYVRLCAVNLNGVQLDQVNFTGADLSKAQLQHVSLNDAVLQDSQLTEIELGEWPYLEHANPILQAVVSPNGCWLATHQMKMEGQMFHISLWDLAAGIVVQKFEIEFSQYLNDVTYYPLLFSPDSRWLALSFPSCIKLWDIQQREYHSYAPECQAWSVDIQMRTKYLYFISNQILLTFNYYEIYQDGGQLTLCDFANYDMHPEKPFLKLDQHCIFYKDPDAIAVNSKGAIISYHYGPITQQTTRDKDVATLLAPSTEWLITTAIKSDKCWIALGFHSYWGLYHLPTRQWQQRSLTSKDSLTTLAFHPHNDLLVMGTSTGQVSLWQTTDLVFHQEIPSALSNPTAVTALQFSVNGQFLAAGYASGAIQIWDAATWQIVDISLSHMNKIATLQFVQQDQVLISCAADDHIVRLRNLSNRQYTPAKHQQTHPLAAQGCLLETSRGLSARNHRLLEQRGALGQITFAAQEYPGWSPLQIAIGNGDFVTVKTLLEKTPEQLNQVTAEGDTLLHLGARYGHLDIVKHLLVQGIDKQVKNKHGLTPGQLAYLHKKIIILTVLPRAEDAEPDLSPLHLALQLESPQVSTVTLLLSHVDIEAKDKNDQTPLYWAAKDGHQAIVKLLLAHHANPNAMSIDGTPLYAALEHEHEEIAELLLARQADVNAKNENDYSLLHRAISENNLEIARFLLAHGADAKAKDKKGRTLIHIAAKSHIDALRLLLNNPVNLKAEIDTQDNAGNTPLHMGVKASKGAKKIIQYLLASHADATVTNHAGDTALQLAIKEQLWNCVLLFLEAGIIDTTVKDNKGNTLLHSVLSELCDSENSLNEILKVVRLLIPRISLNEKNNDGQTPLQMAVSIDEENSAITELLIKAGADIHAKANDGATLLHFVSEKGKINIVQLLLEKGAYCDEKDQTGKSPLYLAVAKGQQEVIQLLLTAGADINGADQNGFTILHAAVAAGNLETVQFLLEKGAFCEAKNKECETPLYIALVKGNRQIAQLFLDYSTDIDPSLRLEIEQAADKKSLVKSIVKYRELLRGKDNLISSPTSLWSQSSPISEIKCTMMGSGNVGKSALTIQFIQNHFIDEYEPTIEDSYRRMVTVNGRDYLLDILDMAGQEEYSAMRDQYMRTTQCGVVGFSVTSRSSFLNEQQDGNDVVGFIEHYMRVKNVSHCRGLILVGNKIDLEKERQVTSNEARELAENYHIPYIETSAKTRQGVDEIFFALVRQVVGVTQFNVDAVLADLLSREPIAMSNNSTALDFTDVLLSSKQWSQLLLVLKRCGNAHNVWLLRNIGLNQEDFRIQQLAPLIASAKPRILDLSHNQLTDNMLAPLLVALEGHPTLWSLDISFNQLTAVSFQRLQKLRQSKIFSGIVIDEGNEKSYMISKSLLQTSELDLERCLQLMQKGDITWLQTLLESGVAINDQNPENGNTALHNAVRKNNIDNDQAKPTTLHSLLFAEKTKGFSIKDRFISNTQQLVNQGYTFICTQSNKKILLKSAQPLDLKLQYTVLEQLHQILIELLQPWQYKKLLLSNDQLVVETTANEQANAIKALFDTLPTENMMPVLKKG